MRINGLDDYLTSTPKTIDLQGTEACHYCEELIANTEFDYDGNQFWHPECLDEHYRALKRGNYVER